MKKIFLALTAFAFLLAALPQGRGADVSVDFFYNNLSGGNWIEVGDYGYGWQPDVAVNDSNWRPYADGYWAYTNLGWTWVSYEDFGWATYHYGRWAQLADYGWVWFPGSDLEWGPAWVSWRTGGDYVGWAPLPPRGPGIVYEGRPIGGRVDIEFDIGPEYYNFVDARFIGEPVLRDRIFARSQNVTYINNTVNVTNITVQNNVVYNYGPDYNALSSRSTRPIQRLNIERQPATDLSAAAKSGALTKVQGGTLLVAAPQKISKPAPGVAPPSVKTKVAQPKIQHGWTGVANEAQLKEKIKTENPKNIPPPTRGAAGASPAAGGISPAASPGAIASPAVSASVAPGERGKRPGRPGALGTPAGSPAGAVSPAPGALVTPTERGKRPGKPGAPTQPGFTPARSPGEAASPAIEGSPAGTPVAPERGKRKGKPGEAVATPSQPTEAPTGGAQNTPFPGKHKGRAVPPEFTPSTGAPAGAPAATQPPGKRKGQFERGVASPTPGQPGGAGNMPEQGRARPAGAPTGAGTPASGEPGGKQKGKGVYAQPGGAPETASPAGVAPGHGKPERGKKKGQEGSPSPGPQ